MFHPSLWEAGKRDVKIEARNTEVAYVTSDHISLARQSLGLPSCKRSWGVS